MISVMAVCKPIRWVFITQQRCLNNGCTDDDMQDLAHRYIRAMRSVQPEGPYSVFGYSFGCRIAAMMVMILEKQKVALHILVCIDGPITGPVDAGPDPDMFALYLTVRRLTQQKPNFLEFVRSMRSNSSSVDSLQVCSEQESEMLKSLDVYRPYGISHAHWQHELVNSKKQFWYCIGLAEKHHLETSQLVCGNVALLCASEGYRSSLQSTNQIHCARPLRIHKVPGNHDSLLHTHNIHDVAETIATLFLSTEGSLWICSGQRIILCAPKCTMQQCSVAIYFQSYMGFIVTHLRVKCLLDTLLYCVNNILYCIVWHDIPCPVRQNMGWIWSWCPSICLMLKHEINMNTEFLAELPVGLAERTSPCQGRCLYGKTWMAPVFICCLNHSTELVGVF